LFRCVQLHDTFDVLSHLTYISKCKGHPNPRIIPLEDHKEVIAEIMKTLIAKGKGMEINTSGVDRCGDYLPGISYLKLFKDLGGEIVTVGSDAHDADRIGQYVNNAMALAGAVFGHVCTFHNHQPIFHKL
jgi:histidinol-phosphatase (PHP family)